MGHGDDVGLSKDIDIAVALPSPAEVILFSKQLEEIAKVKGMSSHLEWLTRQLEDGKCSQDCYDSPFENTTATKVNSYLNKNFPKLRMVPVRKQGVASFEGDVH